MADETDAQLVERAREGDARAFETLVRRHLRISHAVALSVTGETADAEDVCQDAFFTVSQRLDELDPPGRFVPWLLTIVRNRAHDVRRRKQVRIAEPLDDRLGLADAAGGPAYDAERAELRNRLQRAMETLTQTQREVLLFHDLHGWKHREIAEALELAEGTVRSHLFHARRAMREALGPALMEDRDG